MIRWFVVQVHTGCELAAASGVTDLGLKAIAPRLRQRRKERPGMTWRQKQAVRQNPLIEVSLFPGYILAAFDRDHDQWGDIKRLKNEGVVGLVPTLAERPVPIPKIEAERLMKKLDDNGFWVDVIEKQPWEKFEIGQTVRVVDGPFLDFPAMIEQSDSARIGVLIAMFGRDVRTELSWDQVEVV